MCARFTLRSSPRTIFGVFEIVDFAPIEPRYNIAPSQNVLAVRSDSKRHKREAVELRWGLIPSWSKDPAIAYKLLNARAETVDEKPSFKNAFSSRRCLIPADGYYEWKTVGKQKLPSYFHLKDNRPFAFAGLWESWSQEGKTLETCCIITTNANPLAASIHDRMPVIVKPENFSLWLGESAGTKSQLKALLSPYAEDDFERVEVGVYVNNVKNQGVECVRPLAAST